MRINVRFKELGGRFGVQMQTGRMGFRVAFENFQTVAKAPDVEWYGGPYTVRPDVQAQTLETAFLMMEKDLVVREIPYAEVGNAANGITATIG